jgi:hypothetical protein
VLPVLLSQDLSLHRSLQNPHLLSYAPVQRNIKALISVTCMVQFLAVIIFLSNKSQSTEASQW